MALLSDVERFGLWRDFMQKLSADSVASVNAGTGSIPLNLSKTELRAAVNAIDAWVDANAASFNNAIPQPARTQLSARQKAELLMFVVRRRFELT